MRIEAITTCVNYGDFLAHTLPHNLQHVDHMVVVTSHEDKATRDLCNHLGVVCIQTDVFTEHGDPFNKGRGINIGIAHCRNDGLLLHLDADTVLPHRFRYALNSAKPHSDCLYGADRLYVKSFEQWQKIEAANHPQWQDGCHVMPHKDLEKGSRILHGDYGYCPIGYFQLWGASQKKFYPGSAGSSEHSDVLFALQWPRSKRILLPQMYLYHLTSEDTPMGANWLGRKTRSFCPCHSYMLPKSLAYRKPHHHHGHHHDHHGHHHHHHHHHPCPYRPKDDDDGASRS